MKNFAAGAVIALLGLAVIAIPMAAAEDGRGYPRGGGGIPAVLNFASATASGTITANKFTSTAANAADGLLFSNEGEIQWPDTKIAEVGTAVTINAAGGLSLVAGDYTIASASGLFWNGTQANNYIAAHTSAANASSTNSVVRIAPDTALDANDAILKVCESAGTTCTYFDQEADIIAGGSVSAATGFRIATKLTDSNTAPTVVGCSGTAATITASNGSAAFQLDVGTSCAGESTVVLTFPAATAGWVCSCSSTTADRILQQKTMPTASTTVVTMQNVVISTGASGDLTDGADVACMCRGI